MATTPDLHEPQIAAARAVAWHQTGEALLTLEAARTWLEGFGLVLFSPRGSNLGAPAPSLVEATLGTAKGSVAMADSATARTLAARLVGEGSAVPLNLLGGPGDLPDFLVSAQAFPFVFTLRGDKGWKRPPETTGAVKVTPLGLRVYELLSEKGAMTIQEIVPEVGREITESAVARALSELWQLLRVIPVLQQGEGETRWELLTARFLKAVKAGANAGQPTALSGLVSLYLAQVFVATEVEIASFLSPLTARSRVREVLHGLTAARQLAEGVVEGQTVMYIPEALPDFSAFAPQEEIETEPEEAAVSDPGDASEEAEDLAATGEASAEEPGQSTGEDQGAQRIRSFGSRADEAQPRSLRGKPARGAADRPRREGFSRGPRREGDAGTERPRRSYGAGRPDGGGAGRPAGRRDAGAPGGGDRPRRSFGRAEGGERPSFQRPWDEERGKRPSRGPRPEGGGTGFGERPPRFRRDGEGDRPARPFRPREDGGVRGGGARFGGREGGGRSGDFGARGDRPQRPFRETREGDRPFRPRSAEASSGEGGGERPFRLRRQEAGASGGERPFRPRRESFGQGGDRPFRPRREGAVEGGERPFRPRRQDAEGGGDRPFRPRREGSGEGGDRPFRPRREGFGNASERPRRSGFGENDRRGPKRPLGRAGEEGGGRPPRTFGQGGAKPFGARRPDAAGGGGDRPFRPFRPRPEGNSSGAGERRGGDFGARPRAAAGGPFRAGGRGPGGFSKGPKGGGFGARRPGAGGASGGAFRPGGKPPRGPRGERPGRRSPEDEG